jgi:CIC family chloride channel protein
LHDLQLAVGLPTATFAVVGMGSVLAATTRSPLLAMILVFEICLDYSLVPPLMLGSVVAILTASRFHRDSIYTEPLRQRGLEMGRDTTATGAAVEQTVGDLMRAPVSPLRESTPLAKIAEQFLVNANNFLPVVDAQGRLVGVVALQDLKEFLGSEREVPGVIAGDVMRSVPPCVTPGQRLTEALPVVLASEQRNIPVVNSLGEKRLIGSLARAEALGVLSQAISARNAAGG